MASGLAAILSQGLSAYSRNKRAGEEEQRVLGQQETDRAAQARRAMLEDRLLNARITDLERPQTTPRNIDPLSPEGVKARLDYDKRRVRTGRGTGSDPTVVDQRSAVRMANDLYENSDEFDNWDDAFEEAQRRLRAGGRLGGAPAPVARPDPKRPIDIPDSLRTYISGQNRGTQRATKTPAQWVSEVRGEHPDWTPEQVAAEARKRAGS